MLASNTSTQGLLWGTDDYFPALRLLLSTITYSPGSQQLTCLFFFRRLGRGPSIQTFGSGQSSRAADPSRFIGSEEHRSCHTRKGTITLLWWKQNELKNWTFYGVLLLTLRLIIPTLSSAYFLAFYCQHAVLFFIPSHLSAFYNLLPTFCSHSVSFFPQIIFIFLLLLSNFYEVTWK